MVFICFLIALSASVVGGICGVGGGVFMKPILDLTGIMSVSTASFLSGCTVLAMASYSTARNLFTRQRNIELGSMLPLALGAATGGILGKILFENLTSFLPDADKIGAVQALVLGIISFGAMIYTINQARIHTFQLKSKWICCFAGVALGIMSSFLGIGGGPVNLIVFYFLFSMDAKIAAQNSLFTIFFSQLFSLLYTLVSGSVPEFQAPVLCLMIGGGIAGGVISHKISKSIKSATVSKLFILLLLVIVAICIFNFTRYI